MVLLKTLIFLSYYLLFLFSILGYGLFFCNFLAVDYKKTNLGSVGLLGFCFLSFLSYFTNLFVPHDFIHNSIVHFVGISLLIFYFFKDKFYFRKNFYKLFLITFVIIIGLFLSKNNEDFPYYHLSYAINLVETNAIIGFGNLNSAYRTSSSLFYFNSLLYLPYIKYYLFHASGIYILTFANIILLERIFFNKVISNNFLILLSALIFSFINLAFNRLAEYGTDRAGQIIVMIIFFYLLSILNSKKFEINDNKIILVLLIYVVTLKAYFIVYLSLLLFIFYNAFKLKKFKFLINNIKFFTTLFLLFALFIFINFLNSGCLFYPLKFTCFENLIWTPTADSIISHSKWFELWSKAGATPNLRVPNPDNYVQFLNWVPNWFKTYFLFKVTDTLLSIFSIFFIFLTIFIIKKKGTLKVKKIITFKLLYCLIVILFFIWFFKHPDLRYGGFELVVLLLYVPASIYLSRFIFHKNDLNKIYLIIFIMVFSIYNFKNITRIYSELNRTDRYQYNNFPFFYVENVSYEKIMINNDVIIYEPIKNNCWATPAPCVGRGIKVKKFMFFNIFYSKDN
jgi:hypothetical protein